MVNARHSAETPGNFITELTLKKPFKNAKVVRTIESPELDYASSGDQLEKDQDGNLVALVANFQIARKATGPVLPFTLVKVTLRSAFTVRRRAWKFGR